MGSGGGVCYGDAMNNHVAKHHRFSPQVEERLERAAEQLQRPADQVLEDALVHYLDKVERRATLYSEMDRRFEDYQRTGLHLTNAEVKEWLLKRIRGESATLPKAHT